MTRALAGGSAVAILVVGLFLIVDRGSDDGTVVTDSGPDTTPSENTSPDTASTSPQPIPPPTDQPTTESTAGSAPPTSTDTTETSTTAPSNESGWQPATEGFPALAFVACCGTDWEGEPSPAVPTDPAAPLPAGTYNLRPAVNDEAVVDGVLRLEVRPYTRCNELGEFECAGGGPYGDTALGVPTDAARTIDLVLDDSVSVGVSGFACENDRLLADPQISSGTDLAELVAELDSSYETAVAEPLRRGVDPMQLADDLAANPTSGFFDPGCPSYSSIAWTPTSGPTILASSLYRLDAASVPEPFPSAAAQWILPTALVVDENGANTVYFYAGFLS